MVTRHRFQYESDVDRRIGGGMENQDSDNDVSDIAVDIG